MEKEFVPYELALRLKALGFEIKSPYWYNPNGVLLQKSYECDEDTVTVHVKDIIEYWDGVIKDRIDVPTFSQAFRWFREKYNKLSAIDHCKRSGWYFVVREIGGTTDPMLKAISGNSFNTHEEAELACLNKLIELVEQK